jgi:hypothetical protein
MRAAANVRQGLFAAGRRAAVRPNSAAPARNALSPRVKNASTVARRYTSETGSAKLSRRKITVTGIIAGGIAAGLYTGIKGWFGESVKVVLNKYVPLYKLGDYIWPNQYGIVEIKPLSARSEVEQAESYNQAKQEIVLIVNSGGRRLHSHPNFDRTPQGIWGALCSQARQGVSIKILIVDPREIDGESKIKDDAHKTIHQIMEFNKSIQGNNDAKPIQIKLLDQLPNVSIDLIDASIDSSHYEQNASASVTGYKKLLEPILMKCLYIGLRTLESMFYYYRSSL